MQYAGKSSIPQHNIYIESGKNANGIVAMIAIGRVEEMQEKDFMPSANLQKKYKNCKRCGRKLKNPKYQEIGYGPSCYKKMLLEKITKPLFELKK